MKVSLKVWLIATNITKEYAYLNKQLKFLEQKMNIQIELRLITWNRAFDTIIDAFKNNQAPDVFALGTTWVHTFGYLGYLSSMPRSFSIKPLLSSWMHECIHYKQERYAVPYLCETYVLIAKQRTLEDAAIKPEDLSTWEGFYQACLKVSDYFNSRGNTGHIPLAYPIRPEIGTLHRFCVWLFKGGWNSPKLTKGMDKIFQNEIAMKTLQYLSTLIKASCADFKPLHTDTQTINDRFHATNQPFTFFVGNGARYIVNLLNNKPNDEVALYPMPSLVPGGRTFGGGSMLMVSSSCKNPEAAWQVVDFLTGEELLKGLTAISGTPPAYDSSFWAEYDHNPYMRIIKQEHQNSTTYDFHPIWHAVEDNSGEYVAHYLWEALADKKGQDKIIAEQTLKKLDREVIKLLNMMWEMQEDE